MLGFQVGFTSLRIRINVDNWLWGIGGTILFKEPVLMVLPKPLLTEFRISIYHRLGKREQIWNIPKNMEVSFI